MSDAQTEGMYDSRENVNDYESDSPSHENVYGLLAEIHEWMIENDYECGPVGSDLNRRIKEVLKNRV